MRIDDLDRDLAIAESHMPIVYYSGPIGGRKDWEIRQFTAQLHAAVPHPSDVGRQPSEGFHTVYVLRKEFSDTTIYVGKTRDVAARFDSHRKRDWWQFVDYVELNLVSCAHEGNCSDRDLDRAALLIENMAIGNMRPLANKFIPQVHEYIPCECAGYEPDEEATIE